MLSKNPVGILADALIHAENRRRELGDDEHSDDRAEFTIAISRQVGARGTSVACEVGRRLGWPVYDHELLERLAEELKVSVRELEAADERPGNWVTEWAESLSTSPNVNELTYVLRLRQLLLSLGQRGACVIVGRGAAHLLRPLTTVRVRLVAPRQERIAYLSRLHERNLEETARYVETTERERVRFVREHFRRDPTDPTNYDLVLNAGSLTVAACADLIVNALRARQMRSAEVKRATRQPALPLREMGALVDS